MSRSRYPQVAEGEWVQPVRKGYRMACWAEAYRREASGTEKEGADE